MRTMKLALLSLAAGLVAVGGGGAQATPVAKAPAGIVQHEASGIVQIRRGGGHPHFHGGGGFAPRHYHHHHYRPYRYWGGPRVYLYGGGGCYYLKQRAIETGSRYWWRRYHACRNGW